MSKEEQYLLELFNEAFQEIEKYNFTDLSSDYFRFIKSNIWLLCGCSIIIQYKKINADRYLKDIVVSVCLIKDSELIKNFLVRVKDKKILPDGKKEAKLSEWGFIKALKDITLELTNLALIYKR